MSITRTTVGAADRVMFLASKIPRPPGLFVMFETSVYATLSGLTNSQYNGGYWEFYELDNGGWYLAPDFDGMYDFEVASNGFSGTLSADAAGIVATLFAMNGALHNAPLPIKEAKHLTNAYYALKDYGAQHAEAAGILGAID